MNRFEFIDDYAFFRDDAAETITVKGPASGTEYTPLGTTLCPSSIDVDARGAGAKEHRQIKNALKRLRKKRGGTRTKG